jgi:hypothetical protein
MNRADATGPCLSAPSSAPERTGTGAAANNEASPGTDRHAQISVSGSISRRTLATPSRRGDHDRPRKRCGSCWQAFRPRRFRGRSGDKPLSGPESSCQGQESGADDLLHGLGFHRCRFCRSTIVSPSTSLTRDKLPFCFFNSSSLRARDSAARVILKMNWDPAVGLSRG